MRRPPMNTERCPKTIPLTKGYEALVSPEDYEELSKHKWHASERPNGKVYAARSTTFSGLPVVQYMHREIMGECPDDVDHIDGNGLNNVRENLRPATRSQNHMNRKPVGGTSSFKGVHLDNGKWKVQIKNGRYTRSITGIKDEETAALIYDLLAVDAFGAFARTNDMDNNLRNQLAQAHAEIERLQAVVEAAAEYLSQYEGVYDMAVPTATRVNKPRQRSAG
jgi:hypothetical protein